MPFDYGVRQPRAQQGSVHGGPKPQRQRCAAVSGASRSRRALRSHPAAASRHLPAWSDAHKFASHRCSTRQNPNGARSGLECPVPSAAI
eukprot:7378037-Prymnesium_polylepis.1